MKSVIEIDHDECLRRYVRRCNDLSMPTNSINSRVSAIKKFLRFDLNKEKIIKNITEIEVQAFFHYEEENETSINTLNNYYAYLKKFFAY